MGLAAVNFRLEFDGFEGFGKSYAISRMSAEELQITIADKQKTISLAQVAAIKSDKQRYLMSVPRPVRMLLTVAEWAQQALSPND